METGAVETGAVAAVAVARAADVPLAGEPESPAVLRYRRPQDRADALAARALLRSLLPADAVVEQRCATCGAADHGRPRVVGRPELGVSLTHADGWVGAAAGPGPVGLDLEPVTRLRSTGPVAGALTEAERSWLDGQPDEALAFGWLWTRKEALVKAGYCDLDAAMRLTALIDPAGWTLTDHSTPDVVVTCCARSCCVHC